MTRRLLVALGGWIASLLLAACGGTAGHGAGLPLPGTASTTAPSTGGLTSDAASTILTVSFSRYSGVQRPHITPAGRRRSALATPHRDPQTSTGKRSPKFVSSNVGGFQVAVSAGGTTKTAYYAASGSACSYDPNATSLITTCTYTLPYVGGSESIVVDETDTAPTTDGNGNGNGFPANTNILGVGSTTATITLGSKQNVLVHVSEVVAELYAQDQGCAYGNSDGNFLESDASTSGNPRFVFSSGVSTTGFDAIGAGDASGSYLSSGSAPTSAFVDVDGTAESATTSSSSPAFTTFAVEYPGTTNTLPPVYTATTTSPDSSYFFNYGVAEPSQDDLFACFVFTFNYDGSPLANGSTFTIANNLSAKNPFTGQSYGATVEFSLSAVAVSPAALRIAMGSTGTVTGTDYDAPGDLTASTCNSSSGTVLANVTFAAHLSTKTWTEPFTITPSAPGTCTFTLQDNDVDILTMPVTVTITGS